MYSLLFLAFVSFALSLMLTPFVRNLALHFGLVDQPDAYRKLHKTPVPRLGGVAILAATLIAYLLMLATGLSAGHIVREGVPFAISLLPAAAIIFGVGLLDDILQIRPTYKLAAQVGAAALVWSGGIRVGAIAGQTLPILLSFLLTLAWIVACSNAVNLIDGLDGLATGVGLFATVTTIVAALLHHNYDLLLVTVPLAGALFGFLRYNFNPASIFLGDCGSLTLGFLLACYGIRWSEKSTTLISMSAPLLALFIPLLDVCLAVARRVLRRQSIFAGDRSHIHHKLLSRGLSPRRAVLVLYGFCALAAVASLLLTTAHRQYQGFLIVLISLAALLGLQHLGYREFGIAGRLALDGSFQRLLNAQLTLKAFEQEIAECSTLRQCWDVLCRVCPEFGFSGINIRLDGLVSRTGVLGGWSVRIDIPGHGYINLMRESGTKSPGASAVMFIDCIHRVFLRRCIEFESQHQDRRPYAHAV